MKKLFTLLLRTIFVFTACGDEKPFYETFSFDEKVIRKTEIEEAAGDMYSIKDYNSDGLVVRAQYHENNETGRLAIKDELIYNKDNTYFAKHTAYNIDGSEYTQYSHRDSIGNIIQRYSFMKSPDGEQYMTVEETWGKTSDGKTYDSIQYDPARGVVSKRYHVYNSSGRIIELVSENVNGTTINISYDEATRIETRITKVDGVQVTRDLYFKDEQDRFIRNEFYDGEDNLTEYTTAEYYENGVRSKMTSFYPNGNVKEVYTYGSDGKPINYSCYDETGKLIAD